MQILIMGLLHLNLPHWMAKECSRFEHKGIPTCQAWLSFVFNVPVEDVMLFFAIQYMVDFVPCNQLLQIRPFIIV